MKLLNKTNMGVAMWWDKKREREREGLFRKPSCMRGESRWKRGCSFTKRSAIPRCKRLTKGIALTQRRGSTPVDDVTDATASLVREMSPLVKPQIRDSLCPARGSRLRKFKRNRNRQSLYAVCNSYYSENNYHYKILNTCTFILLVVKMKRNYK